MVESPCLMVKTTMKSWGLCRAGNHPRAPEDRFEIGRSWLCAGRTFGQRGPACATSLWCGEEAGRAKYCQWDLSIDFAENSMSFARLVDYVGHRHWKTNGYMMIHVYKCIWSFFPPKHIVYSNLGRGQVRHGNKQMGLWEIQTTKISCTAHAHRQNSIWSYLIYLIYLKYLIYLLNLSDLSNLSSLSNLSNLSSFNPNPNPIQSIYITIYLVNLVIWVVINQCRRFDPRWLKRLAAWPRAPRIVPAGEGRSTALEVWPEKWGVSAAGMHPPYPTISHHLLLWSASIFVVPPFNWRKAFPGSDVLIHSNIEIEKSSN